MTTANDGERAVREAPVQQRPGCKDCFIACIAMAEGVAYDEIARRLDPALLARICEKGCLDADVDRLWKGIGAIPGMHYKAVWGFRGPQTHYSRMWLWGRRAILQMDSINFPGEAHIVYWDGENLHDPSLLKKITDQDVWEQGFHWAWLLSDWGASTGRLQSLTRPGAGNKAVAVLEKRREDLSFAGNYANRSEWRQLARDAIALLKSRAGSPRGDERAAAPVAGDAVSLLAKYQSYTKWQKIRWHIGALEELTKAASADAAQGQEKGQKEEP